jgi:Ca2+-binding RTX toxin-like protein
MTVVNASAATEAVFMTLASNQVNFAGRDPGGNNVGTTQYSWLTSGGDDVQVYGSGIDTAGNPPASGLADSLEIDLSNNNFANPDVEITDITRPNAFGSPFDTARVSVLTASVTDFFNELFALDDTMTGSAYNDTFKSGGGNDVLNMGGGNDSAYGGDGNDTLNGSSGNDSLRGEAGSDVLNGSTGNDTLNGGTGADTMNGSTGNDTYVVDNAGDTVTDSSGTDIVQSSISYTLGATIENLTLTGAAAINGTGNALANVINGNGAANTLNGLAGNDWLYGNAGNDVINGGDGNDILDGGAGIDTMAGGAGNDTYRVDNALDTTTDVGGGIDTVQSSVSRTLGANLENLTLTGAAAISGTGNGLANVIYGNGAANDIRGAGGADILNGAGGDDDYNYFSTSDSTAAARDRITGFTFGAGAAGDKIDLSVIDANTTPGNAGNQAFSFSAAGPGGAGTVWVVNAAVGSDSIVMVNNDADAAADMEIAVADLGVTQAGWAANDFIL